MSNQPLSTAEVARLLRVDVSTVSYWVKTGRIQPAFRLPGIRGAMFFDPSDVDALLKESA